MCRVRCPDVLKLVFDLHSRTYCIIVNLKVLEIEGE
jgi:hypothetical protein